MQLKKQTKMIEDSGEKQILNTDKKLTSVFKKFISCKN